MLLCSYKRICTICTSINILLGMSCCHLLHDQRIDFLCTCSRRYCSFLLFTGSQTDEAYSTMGQTKLLNNWADKRFVALDFSFLVTFLQVPLQKVTTVLDIAAITPMWSFQLNRLSIVTPRYFALSTVSRTVLGSCDFSFISYSLNLTLLRMELH